MKQELKINNLREYFLDLGFVVTNARGGQCGSGKMDATISKCYSHEITNDKSKYILDWINAHIAEIGNTGSEECPGCWIYLKDLRQLYMILETK